MENLQQYVLNKRYAEDTGNRIDPSAESFKTGIEFKSEARSNILNGSFYLLSQAIQYLQFTGGLYDSKASYNEGNIVSCVVKDVDRYRLWKFRRNSNNTGTLTGNAPITGSVETVNGIDIYVLGSVNSDWDKLEDFNYSIEATPNYMIQRDNEGGAKVEMPSVVDDKSIINKEYLKAINVSYEDTKALGATDVQNAIDKLSNRLSQTLTLEPYYFQIVKSNGVFDGNEAPNIWYKKIYGIDTTWELIYSTDSVSLRTEGDLAYSDRNAAIQIDSGRAISGYFNVKSTLNEANPSGAFYAYGTGTTNAEGVGGITNNRIGFTVGRAYKTANEFRMKNILMRMYHIVSINGVNVSDIIGE